MVGLCLQNITVCMSLWEALCLPNFKSAAWDISPTVSIFEAEHLLQLSTSASPYPSVVPESRVWLVEKINSPFSLDRAGLITMSCVEQEKVSRDCNWPFQPFQITSHFSSLLSPPLFWRLFFEFLSNVKVLTCKSAGIVSPPLLWP